MTLDFFKAYDTVEIWILETILVKLIYKNNRMEFNSPVGTFETKISRGVKQGCGLSPLLFAIYVNPLISQT